MKKEPIYSDTTQSENGPLAPKTKLKFIDLFAGLGGFNFALSDLGCECVFASEIQEDLRKLYHINFPHCRIDGDITKILPEDIPYHDILCAGFPCQPFSQAGKRQGFKDEKNRGSLFDYLCKIIKFHRPRYVFLENVSNLIGHDNKNTWEVMRKKLSNTIDDGGLNYEVRYGILSPHQFGVPHHRRRMYIVCENRDYGSLENFKFPTATNEECKIASIIDESDEDYIELKSETRAQLEVWENFIKLCISNNVEIPSFPIWAMEFGATYDFEKIAPAYQSVEKLQQSLGKLGQKIVGTTIKECLKCLPIYAQTDKDEHFPDWKIRYIQQNREFYFKNKKWLQIWIEKVQELSNSHLKMEWNCGHDASKTLYDKIIQFRASGIRVRPATFSPALNLIGTQIPIFPWVKLPTKTSAGKYPSQGRYMTRREAASLQGMRMLKFQDENFKLTNHHSFEALGNAVNVDIVKLIAKNFLGL